LLDGSTFTTYALNTVTIKALPGQHVVQPGQTVPIMLERECPENELGWVGRLNT